MYYEQSKHFESTSTAYEELDISTSCLGILSVIACTHV